VISDLPIPGYAEAVRRENLSRLAAFVPGATDRLCGFDVRPLTARHVCFLGLADNGFVGGGATIEPEDVSQFLWVVSVGFSPDEGRRDAFVKRTVSLSFVQSVREIEDWIEDAYGDAPGTAEGSRSPVSWVAALVDRFASEYGWTDQAILDIPLARLWQYFRCIQIRKSSGKGGPIFINRSDKIRADWLLTIQNP
jgi:hypothetical protein